MKRGDKVKGSNWFIKKPNELGFQVDIANPEMSKKYAEYKMRLGLAYGEPMSNRQRIDFETEIFTLFYKINSADIQNQMGGAKTR